MTTNLPRFQQAAKLVGTAGYPSTAFHIWWDKFAETIESALNRLDQNDADISALVSDLSDAVADIADVQADILVAQADLATAQADIVAAQAAIVAQQAQILEALANMPDVTDIHIAADSDGVPLVDELPRNVETFRYSDTATDVTALSTWAFGTDNGGITASIAGGILEITDITADTEVTVTSTYNGVDKSRSFTAYLDQAAPSVVLSGSVSTSDLDHINSASMVVVAGPLSITVGASGDVDLTTGNLTVRTASTGGVSSGTFPVYGIWQQFIGAVWTDIGTETLNTHSCREEATGTIVNGTLSVNTAVTGLTPAATESFQFLARNNSGTRNMSLSGTISVESN